MKFKEQNLTQAALILLLSTFIVKVIGAFFKIPLSADYALGDLGFGYFSAAYDMYIPIYTLALSGFPVAIARMVANYVAKQRFSDADRVFYISIKTLLVIGLVGFAGFCILSFPIVAITDKSGQSIFSYWAIAPSIFFCCITAVFRGYFEGYKNMIPTAISNIIEALGKLLLGLTGAIITMRITGNPAVASAAAMLGITIGTLASSIYLAVIHKGKNLVLIENDSEPDDTAAKDIFKKLIILTIPVAIASLASSFTSLIDSLTLRSQLYSLIEKNPENIGLLLKDTVYQNVEPIQIPTLIYGIKGKAQTLFNLISTLTSAIGVGALPLVTECFVKKDNDGLKKNTDKIFKYASLVAFPSGIGCIAVGQGIMELLYGDRSAVLGGKILAFYGISAIFAGLSIPVTAILQAMEKQNKALFNILCGIAVKLICNLLLTAVPEINVYGSVIGTALCYIVIFALHMLSLIKNLHFPLAVFDSFLKPLIGALLCGITAFLLNNLLDFKAETIVSIGAGACVYLLVLAVLKVIKKEEIKEFLAK